MLVNNQYSVISYIVYSVTLCTL